MTVWLVAIAVTVVTLGATTLLSSRLTSIWGSVLVAMLAVVAAFAWREIWGLNDGNSIAATAILLGSLSLHYSLFKALQRKSQ